jgi:hypothetical protein
VPKKSLMIESAQTILGGKCKKSLMIESAQITLGGHEKVLND